MNIEQPKIYPGIQKDYEEFARILSEHGVDGYMAKECAFSVFFGWKLCPEFRWVHSDEQLEMSDYTKRLIERNENPKENED